MLCNQLPHSPAAIATDTVSCHDGLYPQTVGLGGGGGGRGGGGGGGARGVGGGQQTKKLMKAIRESDTKGTVIRKTGFLILKKPKRP